MIRFREDVSPVRINFGRRSIRIEDGDLRKPDLVVTGSLPHIVQLTITPMSMGLIPNLRRAHGRAALLRVATGRVRMRGDLGLARRMLEMMAVPEPEGRHRRARKRGAARSGDPVWIDVLT